MRRLLLLISVAALTGACGGGSETAPARPDAPPGVVAGGEGEGVGAGAPGAPGQAATEDVSGGDTPVSSDGSAPPAPAGAGGAAPAASAPGRAPAATAPAVPGRSAGTDATGGVTSAVPGPGAGQPPSPGSAADDGAAVLRRAAAAYENVRSMRAEFVMNFENPLLRQRVTSRGTIYQRQPDRIALRFSEPAGDLIVGDGQYFWVYYPSNNAQQVLRSPAAAAGETAVNLQSQFVGNPVERFNYTLEGTEAVAGRQAHVMLLAPRQRAEYRSLKVWIDDRDSLVRRFEITEHNGSVRLFDLQNLQVNSSIPDTVFRFTPPDGVRIVSAG